LQTNRINRRPPANMFDTKTPFIVTNRHPHYCKLLLSLCKKR